MRLHEGSKSPFDIEAETASFSSRQPIVQKHERAGICLRQSEKLSLSRIEGDARLISGESSV
jgi:hypothetical protein